MSIALIYKNCHNILSMGNLIGGGGGEHFWQKNIDFF